MIRRILVGLGGHPFARSAAECAVDLARRHGSSLTGLAIVDVDYIQDSVVPIRLRVSPYGTRAAQRAVDEVEQAARAAVREFRRICTAGDCRHETLQVAGHPLNALLEQWRLHDLVVLSMRGFFESRFAREPQNAIFRLLAGGVSPILTVADPVSEVRRALIAYHGTRDAAKAMKQFVQFRLWPELELHVVCLERPQEEARRLLGEAAQYCGAHGFEVQTHFDPGPARHRLLPLATDLGADVIVLGSSPRSLILRHILGDTLLTAIRSSDVPLFLSH